MAEGPAEQPAIPASRVVEHLLEVSPVTRHWGFEVIDVALGRVTLTMTVREDMSNTHGVCHGGVIFTLADSCFGFAANSYNDKTAAASCEIKYLRPGKVGDRLTAASNELWRHGRSSLHDVTITNQDGETIALMRGHARLIGGQHIQEME